MQLINQAYAYPAAMTKDRQKELYDLYSKLGVEVLLPENDDRAFKRVIEQLTRMGIISQRKMTLTQTCVILHKRDLEGVSHYRILHFKEMFLLDRKATDLTDEDYGRRNKIVDLLCEWNIITLADPTLKLDPIAPPRALQVITRKEAQSDYALETKYTVGNSSAGALTT